MGTLLYEYDTVSVFHSGTGYKFRYEGCNNQLSVSYVHGSLCHLVVLQWIAKNMGHLVEYVTSLVPSGGERRVIEWSASGDPFWVYNSLAVAGTVLCAAQTRHSCFVNMSCPNYSKMCYECTVVWWAVRGDIHYLHYHRWRVIYCTPAFLSPVYVLSFGGGKFLVQQPGGIQATHILFFQTYFLGSILAVWYCCMC